MGDWFKGPPGSLKTELQIAFERGHKAGLEEAAGIAEQKYQGRFSTTELAHSIAAAIRKASETDNG